MERDKEMFKVRDDHFLLIQGLLALFNIADQWLDLLLINNFAYMMMYCANIVPWSNFSIELTEKVL